MISSASASWSSTAVCAAGPGARASVTGSTSRLRQHEPAEPQRPGRERLARRPGIHDPLGIEPLQRARPAGGRSGTRRRSRPRSPGRRWPRAHSTNAARRPGASVAAERELVGGREQHGGRAGRRRPGAAPCSSTAQRQNAQPGRRDDPAQRVQARVLERHRPVERVAEQRQPLREPGADDDPVGIGDHPARPPQIRRQRRPAAPAARADRTARARRPARPPAPGAARAAQAARGTPADGRRLRKSRGPADAGR